jgi:hypothetical protein
VARFVELGHVLERNPQRLEARHVATCLHAPFHRFEDGDDLSRIPLGAVAGIPGVVVDAAAQSGAVTLELDKKAVKDRAVIIRTGWDERWGTARYWEPGPYLHIGVLDLLVGGGAVLVGVDFWNVTTRPTSRRRLGPGSFEPECSSSSTSATSAVFPARGSDSSPSRSASPAGLPSLYGRSPNSRRGTASTGRPATARARRDCHAP